MMALQVQFGFLTVSQQAALWVCSGFGIAVLALGMPRYRRLAVAAVLAASLAAASIVVVQECPAPWWDLLGQYLCGQL